MLRCQRTLNSKPNQPAHICLWNSIPSDAPATQTLLMPPNVNWQAGQSLRSTPQEDLFYIRLD